MSARRLDDRVVNDVRKRLVSVQDAITDPAQQRLVAGLVSDVSEVLEELQIYSEELSAQNEELAASGLEVQRERMRYHELFDLAPDGYLVTDVHGIILDSNLKVLQMFAVGTENLVKKPLALFISRERHPALFQCLSDLQAGRQVDDIELDIQPREGPTFTVSVAVRNRSSEEGRVWWLFRDISQRKKNEAKLRLDQTQIIALEAIVGERERIRRDLHDSVAQVLGYVRFRLKSVEDFLVEGDIAPALEGVRELEEASHEANEDLRQAIVGLSVSSIMRLGLVGSLREYLARFQSQSGVETAIVIDPGAKSHFPGATEVQLQSIVHEALINVRKHAKATHVVIHFETIDGRAAITISDDGCGFDVDAKGSTQYGLGIVQERAKLLGADLRIRSRPGAGTEIVILMPA